jgi:uncharacterized membrane protein required for colicin V production
MIALSTLFWILVAVFAMIGALRGWSKEMLVTFSLVLGIFVIAVMLNFVPFMDAYLAEGGNSRQFTVRALILILFMFFGYQSPRLQRISDVMIKERFRDSALGIVVGALNGYMLMGSLLYFLHEFDYPFAFVTPPLEDLSRFFAYMPPAWLTVPTVYFAVAVAFTFVVVVLI